ncbi:MAG TPA: DnaJ domain-containing protein, partial [Pyrinomonadaceae bacterium]|nr:DnaJ domain-containing protein [Pyrinomonadaceae bacterium]
LWPQEAFVLSRFENEMLRVEDINRLTGMPDADNLKCLYALWLGGYLTRTGYNSAISVRRLADMQSAKLELKRDAKTVPDAVAEVRPEPAVATKPEPAPTPIPRREIPLESYLNQVERSETHYETLNIPIESDTARVKKAYFDLAKRFHPDLFHRQAPPEQLRRIQNAFTQIAHAYETLRNEESRLRYDYRLKSILAELQRQGKGGIRAQQQTSHKQLRDASEIFDHGFSLLLDEDYEAALPYLTRAVAMAPDVARYHAYYGKVLSVDRTQKFKAETEFQAAIKLEPENPTFRLLLVEFFIDYNLFKRAEGELNRLLEIAPDNYEARAMLDSLLQKS